GQSDVPRFVKDLFDRGELAPLLGLDDSSRIDTRILGACMTKASQAGVETNRLGNFLRDCYQGAASTAPPITTPGPSGTPGPQSGQSDVTRFVKELFDRGELAPLLGLADPSRIDTRVLGACMTKLAQVAVDPSRLAALLRECY